MAELAAIGLTPETLRAALEGVPDAWVAEVGGQAVGFSMADRARGCVFALFVLPGFEGRGVGTGLADLAEAALFERNEAIWLETERTSRAAAFYRRRGFVESGAAPPGDVRLAKRRPADHASPSSSP